MSDHKMMPLAVAAVALLLVLAAVLGGGWLYRGDARLLRDVLVEQSEITPNADGRTDATPIQYELTRNATVSIYFEDAAGQRHYFRREQPRGAGPYRVLFSGVVDGYQLPGEVLQGEILARLLQDGVYTWTVTAADEEGVTESVSGRLTIAEADTLLPDMRNFSLTPHLFTPNQDGIADRAKIQFDLQKEATTRVFVLTPEGAELPIGEVDLGVPPGLPGRHFFDYEGGVDNGATPPPDGTYPVVAIAEDAEGQKIRVEETLTIQYGGVPRAYIISPAAGDTLRFEATAVALCETLFFTITVQNDGATPIRTTGPAPGTVYDSDWNYNTLGWHTESGAWRVGIGFENATSDYPYRWAVGGPDDLQEIDGYSYLMPGERAVVSGGIRITGPLGVRNPQPMWAGLIHEDVAISEFNSRVDPHDVQIDLPDPANRQPCPARAIPGR
ncbi:MAG: hypothetical protein AB1791_20120 [Chloroflexota bacterium]